jgi:hypothetical protein
VCDLADLVAGDADHEDSGEVQAAGHRVADILAASPPPGCTNCPEHRRLHPHHPVAAGRQQARTALKTEPLNPREESHRALAAVARDKPVATSMVIPK